METLFFFGGILVGAIGTTVAIAVFQMVREIDREISLEDDVYSYEFQDSPCKHHSWVEFGGLRGCSICGSTG